MKKPALPLLILAIALVVGLPLLLSQMGAEERTETPLPLDAWDSSGVRDFDQGTLPEVSADGAARDAVPRVAQRDVPGLLPGGLSDLTPGEKERSKLRGRVVSSTGAPVVGARVNVERDWGQGFVLPRRGEDEAVLTDSTGAFVARWVSSKDLKVRVKAAGFAPLTEKVEVSKGRGDRDLGTFTLEAGVILRGVVLDFRGTPLRGAGVTSQSAEDEMGWFVTMASGDPDVTTGGDGGFELDSVAAGPWTILAQHPEHPGARVSGVSEYAGGPPETVIIELPEGGSISGFVQGYQVDEECVVVASRRGELDLRRDPNFQRQAKINAAGQFELVGVVKGYEHDLHVQRSATEGGFWGEPLSESVTAQAGDAGVVLELKGPAGLRFRVVNAETGAPIEDFKAKAGSWWMKELEDADGKVITHHPGGRAHFVKIDEPEESGGVSLHIAAAGFSDYDREGIQVVKGEVLDLGDIALEPAPLLRIRVVADATGEPVKGARVQLSGPTPQTSMGSTITFSGDIEAGPVFEALGQQESRSGRTDAEGWVSLTTMPGVACTLKAQHGKYADLTLPMTEYTGGEVEMRLLAGGAVRVLVLSADGAPESDAEVSHKLEGTSRTESSYDSKKTSAKGEVVFRHLEAGIHSFRLRDERGPGAFVEFENMNILGMEGPQDVAWEKVEVVEGADLELVLHQAARAVLSGRVTEGGRALPGASLKLEPYSGEGDEAAELRRQMGSVVFFGGSGGVHTKGDGSYRMDETVVGEYELVVSHASRVMDEYVRVTLTPGEVELHVDLPSTIIEGVVVDQDGDPVEGVQVSIHQPGVGMQHGMAMILGSTGGTQFHVGTGEDDGRIKTDAAGRFRMRGVTPGCELELQVRGGNYQTETIEISPLRPDEVRGGVRVALTEGGGVQTTLILADGSSPGFAAIKLTQLVDGEPQGETRHQGAEGGTVRIEGLAPGEWRVSATVFDLGNIAQRGEPDMREQEQVVTVKAGEVTEALFQY